MALKKALRIGGGDRRWDPAISDGFGWKEGRCGAERRWESERRMGGFCLGATLALRGANIGEGGGGILGLDSYICSYKAFLAFG
jgi:hypothetical protein